VPDLVLSGPGGSFSATVTVPGDKSLSHRALVFAAIAEGDSLITGLGQGQDVGSTASALRTLGVDVDGDKVRSPGRNGWRAPGVPVDCGNSGTTMRLLSGALATSPVRAELVGDESLMKRPMRRLVEPLHALGGVIAVSEAGTAPILVGGAGKPVAADYSINVASAQVRTAFELAALAAPGSSSIDSPAGFRDHTERWLAAIGRGEWMSSTAFRIHPGAIPPARYDIPGDPSSAAYLWACAAIHPGSTVTTQQVSLNPGRLGFLQILDDMGAEVEAVVTGATGGDPVGDVTVSARGLRGVEVSGALTAAALDELPLVAVVGAYAEGLTVVGDAGELRAKESDRIASVVGMLQALDGGCEPTSDGFRVVGTGFLGGGIVETHRDHRIAMAAAVAATRADEAVTIQDADVASISWPTFYTTLEALWS
jgi:3-phosphoshikimate 1-carboxyvinyltransferase